MRSETLNIDTANGPTTAYVARPDSGDGKAVILIQEWWGLNDHIKDIAGRYAAEGFTAIAPDLYRGKLASNPDEASKMMNALGDRGRHRHDQKHGRCRIEKFERDAFRDHWLLHGRDLRSSCRV